MKKIFFPKQMSEDLAEEIGLHLGDGSMNYYNGKGLYQLRGHIKDDKLHYALRIKPLYKHLFNIDVSLRDMPSTGVHGFQIWSDELVKYKQEVLGLPLGPKKDFSIPNQIVTDDNFINSFIKGFFDTDGCIYLEHKRETLYPRIEITSVSENFIEQLHGILLQKEFRTTRDKIIRKNSNWKTLHRITIRGITMTQKWFQEIRPNNPKHIAKFIRLRKKIEPGEI